MPILDRSQISEEEIKLQFGSYSTSRRIEAHRRQTEGNTAVRTAEMR